MPPQDNPNRTEQSPVSFGSRLKTILNDRNFSQAHLARESHIDRAEINRLCNDKRDPRPHEVVRIARALGMTVADLLDGVVLPQEVAAVRAELERVSEELLQFQQERDEAVAELEAMRDQVDSGRREWERERENLDQQASEQREAHTREIEQMQLEAARQAQEQSDQMAAERQRCAVETAKVKREAAMKEQQLLRELRNAQDAARKKGMELLKANAKVIQLSKAVGTLQAEVSKLKGQRVLTGVLGALGGIMLGASGGGDDDV